METDTIDKENINIENTEKPTSDANISASNMDVEWVYELAANKWVLYDDDITKKLNRAGEDEIVEFELEETKLSINLEIMKQVNMVTGFRRNVRCQTKGDDGSSFIWEFMSGRRYAGLSKTVSIALESAMSSSTTTEVKVQGETYTFDPEVMLLTKDDKSIKLRRKESNAESANAALPVPTASRTRELTKRSAQSVDVKKEVKVEPIEDEPSPPKKSRGKKAAKDEKNVAKTSKGSKSTTSGVKKSTKRTVIMKGRAPVDPECHEKVHTAHVYESGSNVWDAMLNQTNVANNNNKFYILQLLEDDESKNYSVWFRWGRVGYTGQNSLNKFGGNLEEAKKMFCKKFYDKSRNDWADRDDFEPQDGKYTLIKMDYSIPQEQEPEPDVKKEEGGEEDPIEQLDSRLDDRVQSLLGLICNIRTMEETVMQMEYDSEKAPLGKITKDQISEGYHLLQELENFIKKKSFGREFVQTVNEYYTKVPHSFGFRQPPLIKTEEQLKSELTLLETLEEIEIAIRTLGSGKKKGDTRATVDRYYDNMKCEVRPLDEDHEEYKIVSKYLESTHAKTHMYRMKLVNVFALEKEGENERFNRDLGNRRLLWHGSRLTNWYGILAQGLRIAPPEAPTTGYMFGKGVYFADMASKSGNYCIPKKGKTGLLMLAEVALGKCQELKQANYNADQLAKGVHSTFGIGQTEPDSSGHVTLEDGLVVPIGTPKEVRKSGDYNLLYNEYIVYDVSQVKMRYAVEVEFA